MCEVGLHVELIQISIDLCDAQVNQGFRNSGICFVMMCFVIRYPVTPGKTIAKTFLLNISSAFDQKWI